MLDHEKLNVYQSSLDFLRWLKPVFDATPKGMAVRDHLDRASTSVPLNIAEGNGKFSGRDRRRYLEIAEGSALECAAALDVLNIKGVISHSVAEEGKARVEAIVSMLVGLVRSLRDGRVCEDSAEYVAAGERSEKEYE